MSVVTVTAAANAGTVVIMKQFPWKADPTSRYHIDFIGSPYYLMGDAGWLPVTQLTTTQIDTYLENRAAKGFKCVLAELIEHYFSTNAPNNINDDPPFTSTVFTTPNNDYFLIADYLLTKAEQLGICVILSPLYIGYAGSDEGWDTEIAATSTSDMTTWGEYVGNRYKDYTNIIWCIGGDADPTTLLDKVNAFVTGLRNYDTKHLITFHDARLTKGSTNLAGASWLTLQSIYTGEITDTLAEDAYDDSPAKPFFLLEGYYEDHVGTTLQELRAEGYTSWLCGACGYIFGSDSVWPMTGGWVAAMGATGSLDAARMIAFIKSIAWSSLIPDFAHSVLTVGYGTPGAADFAPCSAADDGSVAVIYMPSNRAMTVDMSTFSGEVTGRWFDPTNGSYSDAEFSPFPNTGTHVFSHAGTNSAGDADWILLLEAS